MIKTCESQIKFNRCVFMAQKQCLLIYPLIMLVTGCAINDIGFTKLRYFENETSRRAQNLWRNPERIALPDFIHRLGFGIRLRCQLLRFVIDIGAGVGRYRRGVPVLLAVPRLAGRIPDWFGHLV